jgi:hypothetical protein
VFAGLPKEIVEEKAATTKRKAKCLKEVVGLTLPLFFFFVFFFSFS